MLPGPSQDGCLSTSGLTVIFWGGGYCHRTGCLEQQQESILGIYLSPSLASTGGHKSLLSLLQAGEQNSEVESDLEAWSSIFSFVFK